MTPGELTYGTSCVEHDRHETTRALRAALKAAFPGVPFKVRQYRAGTWGGDCARVEWPLGPAGPTRDEVRAVTTGFENDATEAGGDWEEQFTVRDGRLHLWGLCRVSVDPLPADDWGLTREELFAKYYGPDPEEVPHRDNTPAPHSV